MHNYTSKDLYNNCLMVSNNNKIINIKKNTILKPNNNNYENNNYKFYNNENIIIQSYTNRNRLEQEMNNSIYKDCGCSYAKKIINENNNNNSNRSMRNIFRNNEEDLFYKNLSNHKVKIKNLSCIQ